MAEPKDVAPDRFGRFGTDMDVEMPLAGLPTCGDPFNDPNIGELATKVSVWLARCAWKSSTRCD